MSSHGWPLPPDPVPASGGWPGILAIGSNFNVGFAGPLDNRMTVGSVNDLIALDNPYAGMFASVWTGTNGDTANGLYYFEPQVNAQGIITTNPSTSDWVKVGGGTGNVSSVLVQKTNLPGYDFFPGATAQTGAVDFNLKPTNYQGTFLALTTFYTGVDPDPQSDIYKVGQPGAIPAISYDDDDYIWKQFNLFDLANTATVTWYTQYKQSGVVSGNTKDLYGLNSRITLDKNITFNIGDAQAGNRITSGEVCTLIIKHTEDHNFTLTAGQVNGSAVTHKVVGAGPNPFTLTNTIGAIDIISGLWDDAEQTMYWTIGLNYGGGSAPPPPGNFVELEANTDLVELEGSTNVVEIE